MKDKTKGLLLGLALGSLLSGSVAYANSAQIEVAFRDLKFKFNGVEKQPSDTPGFIYNGTTYVPIRFVGEALGQKVGWDESTSTISIDSVVAEYTGGTVTKADFAAYLAVQKFLNPDYANYESQSNFKTYMVKQIVMERYFESQATDEQKTDAAAKAKDQVGAWQKVIGGEQTWNSLLEKAQLTSSDLEQFAYRNAIVTAVLQSRITDEQLQTAYDEQLKADPYAFTTASVRHILIGLTDRTTGQPLRTKDEALKRANEVLDKLKAGGDFSDLAKQYSDDSGSKDSGGLYADADISKFVPEFKNAAATLPLNQLSDPVLSDYGYHVMKVESRNNLTFEEAKEKLRSSKTDEAEQTFLNGELPGMIQSIQLP